MNAIHYLMSFIRKIKNRGQVYYAEMESRKVNGKNLRSTRGKTPFILFNDRWWGIAIETINSAQTSTFRKVATFSRSSLT